VPVRESRRGSPPPQPLSWRRGTSNRARPTNRPELATARGPDNLVQTIDRELSQTVHLLAEKAVVPEDGVVLVESCTIEPASAVHQDVFQAE
jgi:hypothetical protein